MRQRIDAQRERLPAFVTSDLAFGRSKGADDQGGALPKETTGSVHTRFCHDHTEPTRPNQGFHRSLAKVGSRKRHSLWRDREESGAHSRTDY